MLSGVLSSSARGHCARHFSSCPVIMFVIASNSHLVLHIEVFQVYVAYTTPMQVRSAIPWAALAPVCIRIQTMVPMSCIKLLYPCLMVRPLNHVLDPAASLGGAATPCAALQPFTQCTPSMAMPPLVCFPVCTSLITRHSPDRNVARCTFVLVQCLVPLLVDEVPT